MALKALMLRKQLDGKRKELEALRAKDADFVTREAELEKAIEEAATEEERTVVSEGIDSFEADKKAHEDAKADLEREVGELENDLAAEEEAQDTEPVKEPEKREEKKMATAEQRNRFGITEEFIQRDAVKGFIAEVRTAMKEKRTLTNVGLTIPQEFLGILRQNLENFSKLYRHVNVRRIGGEGRLVVMGTIPEAVWTECCANLNELDLGFNDVEIDCNKVAGYFAVCNAVLEDSDINLASELITALGQAIGLALDKAILYGTGSHMPLGVVTRLCQTSQPAGYPATARTWVDLSSTNVLSISSSSVDAALIKEIILDAAAMDGKYSRGEKVWVMNDKTYATIIANALTVDSAGAIVAGVNGRMPVIGGIIEVLSFIPDDVIIAGYFDLYLLGERAGMEIRNSEHVHFLADETVYKGTARYDGQPVIAEAFVAIGIDGTTPDDTMTFASDTANN